VSCDHCIDARTDDQRKRYAARQHQVEIADARGEPHIGATAAHMKKPAKTGS